MEHRSERDEAFRAAVANTRMPMSITDLWLDDNPIIYCNDAFVELTGYEREEILGRNCRFLQGPETERKTVGVIRAHIAARKPLLTQLLNYRKDGTPFWNQLFISPVTGAGGGVRFMFGSQLDISEQMRLYEALQDSHGELEQRVAQRTEDLQRLVEQRDSLLAELRHRVKNNLQMITSLVSIQGQRLRSSEARRAFEDVRARIEALTTFYQMFPNERVGRSVDLAGYLAQIADNVASIYDEAGRITLQHELTRSVVALDVAVPVGLIVNELLTNCYKHAFPEQAAGTIRLISKRETDGSVLLTVRDDGVGCAEIAEDSLGDHLGWSIIQSLSRQFSGEVRMANDTEGCCVTFRLPAEHARGHETPGAVAARNTNEVADDTRLSGG